jgi:hypothetical protein
MSDRDKLLLMLRKFVKHRERMMDQHGAYKTLEKMNMVTKLLRVCDMNKTSNIKIISKVILMQEGNIRKIMPGRTSNFYESAYKKLDAMLGICKENLKEKING